MAWSRWQLLATFEEDFADDLIDDGPACYELGLVHEDDSLDELEIVYIGETCDLYQRCCSYAECGSHLWEIVDDHLEDGFELYVRYKLFYSKEDACIYERKMLDKYDYPWNIRHNC
ncbi:MAG: hypothetical protein L6Q81_05035 [Bacteroidia bacterium]|nr:hypothetical protein [Bacteroidia bacterium]